MERTRKPTAAGILCIIAGAVFVVPGTVFARSSDPITFFTAPSYMVLIAIVIAPVIMPIVGGIYALRRRRWGLVVAGSISTLLSAVILGIYGIIIILFGSMDNPSIKPGDLTPLVIGFSVCVAVVAILGLLALICVILGKREFESS